MKKIDIFDTTLRDGEQAPGASLSVEQKVRIAHQLAKLGVDVIEPGFPVSSPGQFEAVQRISREVGGVEICGFGRTVKADIDAALNATADAQRRRIHMFLSSSDIHLDAQLKKSREQVVRLAREMVAYTKQFVDTIEFSPMDATRTGEPFLFEMIEAVIAEGATIINIPDTVGYALPQEYGRMFTRVMQSVPGADRVRFSAHCHNDLGLAVANSLAAVQAGVTQVEVTVNGVGERTGNCSLEELVMALDTRKTALEAETNVRPSEIYAASMMVSRDMHAPIAYNKPVVGRNAFRHESGIHQDGLLKNRNTYEIMDPERLGIPRSMIVLGKHSGRHAIKHRIEQMGVELSAEQLDEVYVQFKQKADTQKVVTDDELLDLVGTAAGLEAVGFELVDVQVMIASGRSRTASITVRDRRSGEETTATASGKGPVEAVTRCLKQAMPFDVAFSDMELHAVSAGENAVGEAEVTVQADGESYKGIAQDEDIVIAVAKAFLAACNQAFRNVRTGSYAAADA